MCKRYQLYFNWWTKCFRNYRWYRNTKLWVWKKLIIAKNTGLFKKEGKKKAGDLYKLKEKLINYINENLKVIDEAVVLVFIEEEADEKSDLFKTIDKCGVTCKFEFQKPAQIEKE